MGKRLAAMPDATLERAANDARLSPSARRAARQEIERRERVVNHCPRGAGCQAWDCKKGHA